MRKIREILRLELECGISRRQIAVSCNVARSTVSDYYLRSAQAANLSWEAIREMDEEQLNALLFSDHRNKGDKYPIPDWGKIHEQLKKKGVTLQLLWMVEYKSQNPNGYQSSQFCHLYKVWRNKLGRGRDAGFPAPPRTDPSERNYRTGLLPQVVTRRHCAGQGCIVSRACCLPYPFERTWQASRFNVGAISWL